MAQLKALIFILGIAATGLTASGARAASITWDGGYPKSGAVMGSIDVSGTAVGDVGATVIPTVTITYWKNPSGAATQGERIKVHPAC